MKSDRKNIRSVKDTMRKKMNTISMKDIMRKKMDEGIIFPTMTSGVKEWRRID